MTDNAAPRFEPINRQQVVLEPLDGEQLIAEDHPAHSIWLILGRLDLSRFYGQVRSVEGHAGRNLWEPRLLIGIYAYSRGISSARDIERQCAHEPGLRWLTGLKVVNHHTLSDIRVGHGEALQNLFLQVLGILAMEKQPHAEARSGGNHSRGARNGGALPRQDAEPGSKTDLSAARSGGGISSRLAQGQTEVGPRAIRFGGDWVLCAYERRSTQPRTKMNRGGPADTARAACGAALGGL